MVAQVILVSISGTSQNYGHVHLIFKALFSHA